MSNKRFITFLTRWDSGEVASPENRKFIILPVLNTDIFIHNFHYRISIFSLVLKGFSNWVLSWFYYFLMK